MTTKKIRTALLTGATKGVGRAIAERFASLGLNIVADYDSDDEAATRERDALRASGAADVLLVKANIVRRAEVERLFGAALERFGSLDIVAANAGFEIIDKTFADLEEDGLNHVVDLNFKGTFFVLQQAARHVVDGGRILATASTIALYPPEKAGVYAATKAAVRTMVEVLSKELGPRRVTVNSIAPGAVAGAGVFTHIPDELRATFTKATPLGRMVEPHDVTGMAAFLISADAAMISGQHLGITGGATV